MYALGVRYWLMKSEPDVYSIDDLEKSTGPAMWEGCRNYTVRNFFRDTMDPGDLAFFYHSNADPAGIVGTMKIVGDPYADPTQFDEKSEYYDPKSDPASPRWLARDVVFEQKFTRIVTLAELKTIAGLEEMFVTRRGQRLSVMPVTESEWLTILALPGLTQADMAQ
jgi:predicted RNA-binding protein with PUA-like domain